MRMFDSKTDDRREGNRIWQHWGINDDRERKRKKCEEKKSWE